MATLSVNGLNPEAVHHHHHHILPYNPSRGLHPRYQRPDLNTIGSISSQPPQFQLNYHRYGQEDLVHIPEDIYTDKDNDFCIYLDVGLFTPEELTVKIVNDHLVIEGLHKEREAHDMGFVERHFKRRYDLPKGYNPDALISKLSTDGTLNVVLPKNIKNQEERIIPIQHTGPSQFFLKYEFGNDDVNISKNKKIEDLKKENANMAKTKKVELKDEKEKKMNS